VATHLQRNAGPRPDAPRSGGSSPYPPRVECHTPTPATSVNDAARHQRCRSQP